MVYYSCLMTMKTERQHDKVVDTHTHTHTHSVQPMVSQVNQTLQSHESYKYEISF